MMKTGGIDATIGYGKGGLWYDTEASSGPNKTGFGIRIGIRWGPMWVNLPTTWKGLLSAEAIPGKVVTLPFVILPFVSVVIGTFGCYLGGKYNGWDVDDTIIPSVRIAWFDRLL